MCCNCDEECTCYDEGYGIGYRDGYNFADNEQEILHVVNNWAAYREVIRDLYYPWIDTSNDADAVYFSDPNDLRCKLCGCDCVVDLPDKEQPHARWCVWWKIERLYNMDDAARKERET